MFGPTEIYFIIFGLLTIAGGGYFLPRFFRTSKMMPAGMMSLLSILGMIFVIVAWVRK